LSEPGIGQIPLGPVPRVSPACYKEVGDFRTI